MRNPPPPAHGPHRPPLPPSMQEGLVGVRDLRDKPKLTHQDVMALNFIGNRGGYVFRRHFRTGLRSHIMEVLDPAEVRKEKEGVLLDGVRCFPRARPLKMLRIFRTRFRDLEEAEGELSTVQIVNAYLAPAYVARSEEFLVDLEWQERRELLLCGLQEYVEGEILDPWRSLEDGYLGMLFERMAVGQRQESESLAREWIQGVREKAGDLVQRLKRMILDANTIPDLAGAGNLILAPTGHLKLVDINNISRVPFDSTIRLDDRGYPVCDKSVEALSVLEKKLAKRCTLPEDPIYRIFLNPRRLMEVKALEQQFHNGSGRAQDYFE